MATPKGLLGASKARRTGEGRGNRPAAQPEGKGRKASAPASTRKGFFEEASASDGRSWRAARPSGGAAIRKGISKGFGFEKFLERRDGFDPASFERATGEASASMRALERARLRPGPIRKGRDGQDFGPVQATRRGSVRDFRVSPETHRDPNGASRPRSGIRGKAKRASCPPRDPKPPSERWPRHPATAVKAGTSGGRWRHRPSL